LIVGPNPFKVEIILRELDVPFEKVSTNKGYRNIMDT
jgi:hypothetical protein